MTRFAVGCCDAINNPSEHEAMLTKNKAKSIGRYPIRARINKSRSS